MNYTSPGPASVTILGKYFPTGTPALRLIKGQRRLPCARGRRIRLDVSGLGG